MIELNNSELNLNQFYWEKANACLANLPNDKRVNKDILKAGLLQSETSFYNPNTDRFYKSLNSLPNIQSKLKPINKDLGMIDGVHYIAHNNDLTFLEMKNYLV